MCIRDSYTSSDTGSTYAVNYVEPLKSETVTYDGVGYGYANRHWGRGDSTLFNSRNLIYIGYTKPTTSWDASEATLDVEKLAHIQCDEVAALYSQYKKYDIDDQFDRRSQLLMIGVRNNFGRYNCYINDPYKYDEMLTALYSRDRTVDTTDIIEPTEVMNGAWALSVSNKDSVFSPDQLPGNAPRAFESLMHFADRIPPWPAGGPVPPGTPNGDDDYFRPAGSTTGTCQFCWPEDGTAPTVEFVKVYAFWMFGKSHGGGSSPAWNSALAANAAMPMNVMPFDSTTWIAPMPGQGININRDTTLEKCRAICDRTMDCNFIAIVPILPETNTRPGCYMYSETMGAELTWEHWRPAPAEAVFGIKYGTFASANIVYQERQCPLGTMDEHTDLNTQSGGFGSLKGLATTLTDFSKTPSVAFGEVADNSDVKIAFLDGDAYADVITVSGRDHVDIYRGSDLSQLTGDFSTIVPETVDASALRARDRRGRRAHSSQYGFRPYSRFPGDASEHDELANALQLFVADFDGNGHKDLFLHSPAPSAGSCAQRCHRLSRFGYDSFEVRHTNVAADDEAEPTYCYCGPHYDLMIGPGPPPSPPAPPPSPSEPPAPPPTPTPDVPPPSPPFP